jgi:hypothetical protein
MSETLPPIKSEPAAIRGPDGTLEAVLDIPEQSDGSHIAVICHPHPQYGGTMTNKVVHMLAKSFNALDAAAVRFNFRGVGRSGGTYAQGEGETHDALAVLDWAAQRWPSAALSLAGFSFGGAVAIRAGVERTIHRLVTVAPAIDRVSVSGERLPSCPWLLIQGDRDELVDPARVRMWVDSLTSPPELTLLPGVDHFFHGRLNDLKDVVVAWLTRQRVI